MSVKLVQWLANNNNRIHLVFMCIIILVSQNVETSLQRHLTYGHTVNMCRNGVLKPCV